MRFAFLREALIAKTPVKKTAKAKAKPAAKAAKPAVKKAVAKAAPKAEVKPAPKPKAAAASVHKLHEFILKTLDKDKVEDVVSIDLKGKTTIADFMVIATGTSSRQVTGTASKLRDSLAAEGVRARVEGQSSGDWVIVDAGDVIVHLFRAEVRTFYNLERMWAFGDEKAAATA